MADSDKVILLKIELDKAQASANIEKLKNSLRELDGRKREARVVSRKLRLEEAKLANLRLRSSKSIDTQAKSIQKLTKVQKEGKTAVGASTSATLELGRVLSDMPYGIRGVANNLQQLASNLFFMSKATDAATGKSIGFGGAIGTLIKGLAGPAGILIAFQGVIALFDYFSGGAKKATESTKDLNKALKEEIETLNNYSMALANSGDNLEARSGIVKAAIMSSSGFLKTIKDSSNALGENTSELNRYVFEKQKEKDIKEKIASLDKVNKIIQGEEIQGVKNLRIEQAKLQKLISRIVPTEQSQSLISYYKNKLIAIESVVKAYSDQIKLAVELNNLISDREVAQKGSIAQLKQLISAQEKHREMTSTSPLEYEALSIAINNYQKEIDRIIGKKNKGEKTNLSPFDTPEELELKVKSTLDARQKLAQQTELIQLKTDESATLSMAKSEEDKTFIKEDYAKRRLDITEKYEKKAMESKKLDDIKSASESHIAYVKKIDKDLAAFEAKLGKEGKALTSAEKKMLTNAKKAASDKKESAGTELMDTVAQIEAEYTKLFPFWELMAAARKGAIGEGKPIAEAEEYTLEDGLNQYMELQSSMTSFLGGEYDRQLTIEQNKTNALNNELNQRLLNEDLSKDERERIQLQIGQNDEKLRKKQEQIEKKRFKLNKAANIATASINTYLAASQIMADPSFVGRPVARFVAMAATITTGLLNVAKIARTKFQSSAGSGGSIGAAAGSNGGEGESREFNFNLAGSTQSNQLTQSIAGQLNQPIQTYVVSSEITSQQQLDLSISNTASLG